MQDTIGQICPEDASKLKPYIGHYAAVEPDMKGLELLIFSDNKKSRTRMGVNHPQIAAMLCPIKHLTLYNEDHKKIQAQLQNGEVKMHAAAWPAFAYEGDSPGENFDLLNMQDGLFKGYLMKWVFRHIFKGPSSALVKDREAVTTCSGNAKLHNMTRVDAEHIAYTFVQACMSISSRNNWQATDGNYNYHDTYYRIIKAIRDPFDQEWADSLLKWWNM
ncbi:uncharacterized protein EDB91DRAFT_1060800 [Suillus paluster]|uniref:uncharacterized protein n=1 Tax=Suillus paluster TaxID=48578 RepID=UPI001B87CC7D|nr:uncharacterized protein EDB91DRAFT_1060800 [Suillus paluster]KAG1728048.1 hypothetical protein EDB91DRAFT_1060800 [Suillus paluster]